VKDIDHKLLTAAHLDHLGSLADIKVVSGTQVFAHPYTPERAAGGNLDKATGFKLFGKILEVLTSLLAHFYKIRTCKADIILDQETFPLKSFGLSEKIFNTTGHTKSSVILITKKADAFAVDLSMGGFPKLKGQGMRVTCNNPKKVTESWNKLTQNNVKLIYPAQGKTFPVSELNEETLKKISMN
jgi:glyoxylase-like metal-dependent hydrolase (beta-lactamase superfamily II)